MVIPRYIKLFIFLLVLSTRVGYSQVPSSPILWLRADAGVDTNSTGVTGWHDQSGLHHDAVQTQAAHRPLFASNGLNGLPAVTFHGWHFFNCDTIFPTLHSYSFSAVLQLDDTTVINNLFSGNGHAIWFNGSSHLGVMHADPPVLNAVATVPIRIRGSWVTVIFDSMSSSVRLFVDGRISDSLSIPQNQDPTLYLGAYRGAYCLQGALSEVMFYDRLLSPSELGQLDSYISAKYALAKRPPPPSPDTTFSAIPAQLQFFPRDVNDSATIPISGSLRRVGFDSIYLETLRNGIVIQRDCSPLAYSNGAAPFSFSTRIHAELSEYGIRVGVKNGDRDSIVTERDSLVCGDTYLICGQSNALRGFSNSYTLNPFVRTFGNTLSLNIRDTLWSVARSEYTGWYNSISAWSLVAASLVTEQYHIPICVISGATSGEYIEWNIRDDSYPLNMFTVYGRLLYKVRKAHLDRSVKAMLWTQGEWNTDVNYFANFQRLTDSWLKDFPSIQKIYVSQLRPNQCGGVGNESGLKDLVRHLPDSFSNVQSYALAAIPYFDGCHFMDSGYVAWGHDFVRLLARDFFGSSDTTEIRNPNLRSAYYTTPAHDEIALEFEPANSILTITADTSINGKAHTLKDYIYLDDSAGYVSAIKTDGHKLLLKTTMPSASRISYLPDRLYPDDTNTVYNGPWIVNSRGLGAFIFYDVPIGGEQAVGNAAQSALSIRAIENPAHGRLSLWVSGSGSAHLEIIDDIGRILLSSPLELNPVEPLLFSIALPGRTSAAYFCRVVDSSGTAKMVPVSCEQ